MTLTVATLGFFVKSDYFSEGVSLSISWEMPLETETGTQC